MKISTLIFALALGATSAFSQSDSFLTIKNTFKGGEDVHSVSLAGWLCRMVLNMSGEHEFKDVITDVKSIRFISVPQQQFRTKKVSVAGFKGVLNEDEFHELANFRDSGDYVTFYVQEHKGKHDRFFILVENRDEVVGIEMHGKIDMNALLELQKGSDSPEVSA